MLYQSIGSSTCAIVATANLLHLYGQFCSRDEVRRLFGSTSINSKFTVSHPQLLQVIAGQLCCGSLHWTHYRNFSFDRLSQELENLLRFGAPALLTFHMRHRNENWFGIHCVVVVEVDDLGIHIIDSLGRRDGRIPNATIAPNEFVLGWRVSGAPLVVMRKPARILCGLPQLSASMGRTK